MTAVQVQVRWDATAIKIAQDVIKIGMSGPDTRAEIARRFGVPSISDNALRNAFARAGLVLVYGRRFVPPSTARGIGPAEVDPPTQRSERVPTTAPQPSGRVEVLEAIRRGPKEFVPKDDERARVASERAPQETACRAFVAPAGPRPLTATAHERVLVIPDVHIPVNDKAATDLAIAIGFALKPTTIVVLGDTLDFAPLSFHQRTRKVHSLREEIDGGRAFFRALEQIGAPNLVLTLGNHEFRLDRYIHGHAPAIADLDGMSVDAMLGLSANGWRVVQYHDGIKIGGVYYTHEVGHCGIHAVRTSGDRMASPIVIGHVHSLTGVEMHSIDGEPRGAWSFGWLGDMDHIDYRHRDKARRDWPHAVGVVYGDEDKNAWAQALVMRDKSRVANVHGRIVRAA